MVSFSFNFFIFAIQSELSHPYLFVRISGGCVVTRVSPDGSASRSGGVEVGDQLAAINGTPCVHLKVDDICHHIAASPNTNLVELVFLRYQGPIRPADGPLSEARSGSFDLRVGGSDLGSASSRSFDAMSRSAAQQSLAQSQISKKSQKSKKGFRWFRRKN
jgi:hypothetical protein